jgi:hypothetical protein
VAFCGDLLASGPVWGDCDFNTFVGINVLLNSSPRDGGANDIIADSAVRHKETAFGGNVINASDAGNDCVGCGRVRVGGVFGVHVFGLVSVALPRGNTGSSHILRRVQVFFIPAVHFVPLRRKRAA